MRKYRPPARSLCNFDGLERLRKRADLVDLDEKRIGDAATDPVAQPLRVGDEQIVPDELDIASEFARQLSPAFPIVLGHSVLDRHDRIAADEIGPIGDEPGGIEGLALSGETIGSLAIEF